MAADELQQVEERHVRGVGGEEPRDRGLVEVAGDLRADPGALEVGADRVRVPLGGAAGRPRLVEREGPGQPVDLPLGPGDAEHGQRADLRDEPGVPAGPTAADEEVGALHPRLVGRDPELAGQPEDGVVLGCEPRAAAVHRRPVPERLGPDATAHPVAGLEHDDRPPALAQPPSRGETRVAGPHDADVCSDLLCHPGPEATSTPGSSRMGPRLSRMGVAGPKVLDISDGIPGAYAALLLHHAGATVARGEPSGGDPMRRWRLAPGEPRRRRRALPLPAPGPDRGAHATTCRTTPAAPTCCSRRRTRQGAERLRAIAAGRPDLTVVAITAFGLDGTARAPPGQRPHHPGRERRAGHPGPARRAPGADGWAHGRLARRRLRGRGRASSAGAAARRHGRGLFVDLALVRRGQPGRLQLHGPHARHRPRGRTASRWVRCGVGRRRRSSRPSDGWVGFNTNSPHHFEAFLRMLERPDLIETRRVHDGRDAERAARGVERGHPRLDPPPHHRRR